MAVRDLRYVTLETGTILVNEDGLKDPWMVLRRAERGKTPLAYEWFTMLYMWMRTGEIIVYSFHENAGGTFEVLHDPRLEQ